MSGSVQQQLPLAAEVGMVDILHYGNVVASIPADNKMYQLCKSSPQILFYACLFAEILYGPDRHTTVTNMKPSDPDSNIKVNAKSPGGGQKGRI